MGQKTRDEGVRRSVSKSVEFCGAVGCCHCCHCCHRHVGAGGDGWRSVLLFVVMLVLVKCRVVCDGRMAVVVGVGAKGVKILTAAVR